MSCIRGVAAIVGIAAVLAGCAGSQDRNDADRATPGAADVGTALHPDLGPFAGYSWDGVTVHEVSAVITLFTASFEDTPMRPAISRLILS